MNVPQIKCATWTPSREPNRSPTSTCPKSTLELATLVDDQVLKFRPAGLRGKPSRSCRSSPRGRQPGGSQRPSFRESTYYPMSRNTASGSEIWLPPDSNRKRLKVGPPAGRRPAGGPILTLSKLESSRNPVWRPKARVWGTAAPQTTSGVGLGGGVGGTNIHTYVV